MNLFAYISLEELSKILQRRVNEIGSGLDYDQDKVCSQEYKKGEKYIELFEDLESVKIMQQFYGKKPDFFEGGVVVKVRIPSHEALPRMGTTIFRLADSDKEDFVQIRTYNVKSDRLRISNFEDAVFDPSCQSFIEDIRCDFNFTEREKF